MCFTPLTSPNVRALVWTVRVVKQRLLELAPDFKVFLDVDDLSEGLGAESIDTCATVTVFCTARYFRSRPCALELLRAVVLRRPILAILEPEKTEEKGGLNEAECRRLLVEEQYVVGESGGGAAGGAAGGGGASRVRLLEWCSVSRTFSATVGGERASGTLYLEAAGVDEYAGWRSNSGAQHTLRLLCSRRELDPWTG